MIVLPTKRRRQRQSELQVRVSHRRRQYFLGRPKYPECSHAEGITQEMLDRAQKRGSSDILVTEGQREVRNADAKGRAVTRKKEIRQALLDRQQAIFPYCGDALTPDTMHVDRIMPVRYGGTHDLDNLQAVRALDNKSKGALSDEEYRQKLNRIQWHTSEQYARQKAESFGMSLAEYREFFETDVCMRCISVGVPKNTKNKCSECGMPLCTTCAGKLCSSCQLQAAYD